MIPVAGLGLRLASLAVSAGRKAKKLKHAAMGAAATVAEKAAPKVETMKHLAMGAASEYPTATKVIGGAAAGGIAGAVAKKALTKEGEEEGEVDADDEAAEKAPAEVKHSRASSGAHVVVIKDPESVAYKVAAKFGSPDETKDGFRFSLTDDEYSRFKREAA